MIEVSQRFPATIPLKPGHILRVEADPDSRGTVWLRPPNMYGKPTIEGWVKPEQPLQIGPFSEARIFRVEATTGILRLEAKEQVVAQLERTTERIKSARIIAHALVEGRKAMSLQEKFKRLAERSKEVPAALEKRADALMPRLDQLETKGEAAMGGLDRILVDAESAVQSAEDALNQLTNGGPPLEPSA